MIILDEPPSSSKLSGYSDVAGPTLRFPDRVAGRSSTLTLPDYETSQALAQSELSQKNHVKKKVDSRCVFMWGASGLEYAKMTPGVRQVLAGDFICFDNLHRSFYRYWRTYSGYRKIPVIIKVYLTEDHIQ